MEETSFEAKSLKLRTELPKVVQGTEAYLVCNIFTRFSLYLVSPTEGLLQTLKKNYSDVIDTIEAINCDGFIYDDLQNGKEELESKFFYIDRHTDKNNWFLETDKLAIKSKVVSFYSFKGGLGRTTALVLSAIYLARQGKKVVLVDFDLEAPGLASLFLTDYPQYVGVRGVTDYMLDLAVNKFEGESIDLASYYFVLNHQDLVGRNGGELIIFPAASSDYEAEGINYIDKLSKVNIQFSENQPYAPDYLIKAIDEKLRPDFLLLDTRTGVNDIGGLVFHRYADFSFMFFYGNQQNMFGLSTVLEKVRHLDAKFYLINSPVPREEKMQEEEITYFIESSYNIFCNSYYASDSLPDINDKTSDHYPINVPYSDTASFLNSTRKLRALLEESGSENPYVKLGELMLAEEDEGKTADLEEINSQSLVLAMSRIIPAAAASENEFFTEDDLRQNFYPRRDYRFIFDRGKFLILGEKGSGKTALYAVLSHDNYAKELAQFCEMSNNEWRSTTWIKGLDTTDRFPSQTNFRNLKDLSDSQLRNYWLLLLSREIALHLGSELPKASILDTKFSQLKALAKDDDLGEALEEFIHNTNRVLKEKGTYLTVVYDYLDRQLSEEDNLRGRLVGALLGLWYEYQNRFSNLRAKVFLRKDIYEREIPTGLTDKVKLDNFKQEIEWEQTQLLDLVWKRILEKDPEVATAFIKQINLGYAIEQVQGLGYIPILNEEQHAKILERLFGKRMGGNNKAFPYNWIEQHIADTHRNIQPRSILNLFGLGAGRQINDSTPTPTVIRAFNFENILAEVSKRRVRDLEEEYPAFKPIFDNLNQYLVRFPVTDGQLVDAIEKIISSHSALKSYKPDDIITKLMEMGVLYEYKYNKKNVGLRYHIPDLYLFGLGLSRVGPGAHKAMFDKRGKKASTL